jgi:hypothetical protein
VGLRRAFGSGIETPEIDSDVWVLLYASILRPSVDMTSQSMRGLPIRRMSSTFLPRLASSPSAGISFLLIRLVSGLLCRRAVQQYESSSTAGRDSRGAGAGADRVFRAVRGLRLPGKALVPQLIGRSHSFRN